MGLFSKLLNFSDPVKDSKDEPLKFDFKEALATGLGTSFFFSEFEV